VSGSRFDVGMLVVFGLLGYAMRKLDYPAAPLVLGLVLGDTMERALRQSLMMSQGDLGILVSRPISAVILCLAAVVLVAPLFKKAGGRRLRAVP
jgi:putative tricarboxylic transport membrane protein